MRACIRLAIVLVTLWAATVTVAADEKAPAAPAAPAAAAAKDATAPAAATARFNKQYGDWKVLLSQLRKLRDDYAAAQPLKKPEIEKQFKDLIAKGDATLPALLEAAKGASRSRPPMARSPSSFRRWRSTRRSRRTTRRVSLADLLIKKGSNDPGLCSAAGVAAFCVGELDKAEKYLEKGKDAAGLGKEFSDLAPRSPGPVGLLSEAWPEEVKIRQAEAKADDLPRVVLKTNRGDIELELFENEAPNTVANFIALVEKHFYDGVSFHRVLPYFMAQGGDPKGDGTGGPGYTIPDECHKPDHRLHFRGTLSMAKTGARTAAARSSSCASFPRQPLDGKHTVFGRVVKGIDVLAKLPAPRSGEASLGRARQDPPSQGAPQAEPPL